MQAGRGRRSTKRDKGLRNNAAAAESSAGCAAYNKHCYAPHSFSIAQTFSFGHVASPADGLLRH